MRGIGEKFATNPVTGSAGLSVPLPLAPGRGGFGPSLTLTYDSGAGNGPFGVGWSMSVASVTRKTDKGLPRYADGEDSDVFVLAGTEDLVPLLVEEAGTWAEPEPWRPVDADGARWTVRLYRPRAEGAFLRIERWTRDADGDVHWRTVSRDSVTTLYGRTPASRIADPADPLRIFSWLVCESWDDRGNAVLYDYVPESSVNVDVGLPEEAHRTPAGRAANRYLKRVRYGNATPHRPGQDLAARADWRFELVLDYGEHDPEAPQPGDTGPWPVRADPFSTRRAGFEVRTYRLCRRALMFHHFPEEPDVGANRLVAALELGYAERPTMTQLTSVRSRGYKPREGGGHTSHALPPLELRYAPVEVDQTVREPPPETIENLPAGLGGAGARWVDLDGDGLPGVLLEHEGSWRYKPNLGGSRLGAGHELRERPSLARLDDPRQALLDLAGDGRIDAAWMGPAAAGLAERTEAGGWGPFRPFERRANADVASPDVRLVDLTGDGLPDLLEMDVEGLRFYRCEGDDGFAPPVPVRLASDEERGPRPLLDDAGGAIHLADMTGDGLADVVRVRNGEVSYWPSLGYGAFGPRVTMSRAPRFDAEDQFDPGRLLLADVDGSGTTDLVYLHPDGPRLYANEAGNGWAEPHVLHAFPRAGDGTDVRLVDLLGTGTACLVWSSALPHDAGRPLRYVDLMHAGKPHLLVEARNGMGLRTRLEYTPSTTFLLADRAAGRPWQTQLPFPVHCLSRMETVDEVTGHRAVTERTYHHGHFDAEEREFRGFGRVDQRDTESIEDFGASGAANALEPELQQPPVLTRTWFHTGALEPGGSGVEQFRDEWLSHPALDPLRLTPPPLEPPALADAEYHEALRAARGTMLRQEVYALDAEPDADRRPYAVTETTARIVRVQPRGPNPHGSFLVTPCETLAVHCERDPDDPRIAHELVLATDRYGTVTREASVAYGRRADDPELPAPVRAAQRARHVTYSEIDVTDEVEVVGLAPARRLPVAYEARAYEVTGIEPAGQLFRPAELLAAQAATALAFDDTPGPGPSKRLVGRARTTFLRDDLAGPLPAGRQGALGLVHRSYTLALTPSLVASLYGGRVTDADLTAAGYLHLDGDEDWWIPSGTVEYGPDPFDHFLLPRVTVDPFGGRTAIDYRHDLVVARAVDAIGNVTTAEHDFRLLTPRVVTDPNGNRSEAAFDELGRVVATAVMGKAGDGDGDTIADPTLRIEYHDDRWVTARTPIAVRTREREEHGAANPRWQETWAYAGGGGQVVLRKVQAEPGVAKRLDPATGVVDEVDTTPAVRWVGTGRTVLNNKGMAVKEYEPYFSVTHEFERAPELVEGGVSATRFYDPLGRLVRVEFPDGTLTRSEVGAWGARAFDAVDTVRDSPWYVERGAPDPAAEPEPADPERRAAWLAARHAGTPAQTHADSLGRAVLSVADNGAAGLVRSRSEADLTGAVGRVFDALDREVASSRTTLAGAPARTWTAERGDRFTLMDAGGRPFLVWDGMGRRFRTHYDALRRPTRTDVREPDGTERVVALHVYGESHPDAAARNLRGALHRIYDQAGAVLFDAFAFNGVPKAVERRLARVYDAPLDWSPLTGHAALADLVAAAEPLLEPERFTGTTVVDALGRLKEMTLPDGTVVRRTYGEGNYVETIAAQIRGVGPFRTYLAGQEHDAKGQRLSARFGNGTTTSIEYDPRNFRPRRRRTSRDGDGAVLQDLRFVHDPVGNVTHVADAAQQTRFFQNAVVPATWTYEHDALSQLVRATGRERAWPAAGEQRDHRDPPVAPLPHPNDPTAVRTYTETYSYDAAGNIREMHHAAVGGSWTRRYRYAHDADPADARNRLLATSLPGDAAGTFSAAYGYDDHGNLTSAPHVGPLAWDHADQLREVDLGGGGRAFHVHAGSGARIRKVVERVGSARVERIALGVVEIERHHTAAGLQRERVSVSILEPAGEVARVTTKTVDTADATLLGVAVARYQHGDLLGSRTLELDDAGAVVSYEEFHPFGTSAYRSGRSEAEVGTKRHRFSGKERDEETGFHAFGARFYASWLGRWTSCDPAGFADGLNLYRFVRNNPTTLVDPDGCQSDGGSGVFVPFSGFTGNESLDQIREFARAHNLVIDPSVNESNFRAGWRPHPTNPGGVGGRWALPTRPMTPQELAAQLQPATVPQAAPGTNLVSAGSQGAANYRQNNVMPPGTQAQHWTKQIESRQVNMDPGVMNQNMSPLQSRNAQPATLLLTDPRGGGTRYSVSGNGGNFGNEHTFADRYLIPRENARIQAANPGADPRAVVVEAGRQARWIMEGNPGPAPGNGAGFGVALPANQVVSRLPQQSGWQRAGETLRNVYRGAVYTMGGQNRVSAFGTAVGMGLIPGFAEAYMGATMAPAVVASLGITNSTIVSGAAAMAAAPAATAAVVVASAAAGYIVGDVVERAVTNATGSRAAGVGVATASAALTGAAIGAAIGTIVPVLGTGVGAAVGAIVGGVAGFIGAFW
ncbi:MAG TPA: SpvB/TcaC N-terminal domain-containing protein [Solirubrobacteraceae bacterium]|nr:SpvB/TcaC N-terminal domain-containing protein [Solirubrobacteraceae bacterium]